MKIKALLTFRKHLARKKRDKDDEREKDSRSLFYSLSLSFSVADRSCNSGGAGMYFMNRN